jgi:hypothetical protein
VKRLEQCGRGRKKGRVGIRECGKIEKFEVPTSHTTPPCKPLKQPWVTHSALADRPMAPNPVLVARGVLRGWRMSIDAIHAAPPLLTTNIDSLSSAFSFLLMRAGSIIWFLALMKYTRRSGGELRRRGRDNGNPTKEKGLVKALPRSAEERRKNGTWTDRYSTLSIHNCTLHWHSSTS